MFNFGVEVGHIIGVLYMLLRYVDKKEPAVIGWLYGFSVLFQNEMKLFLLANFGTNVNFNQ